MSVLKSNHQSFHIGVKAIIAHQDKVLLLKCADVPSWEPPGGRIDVGEAVETALVRELCEELPGIHDIQVGDMLHAEPADFTLPDGKRLMLLYFRVAAALPDPLGFSDEHVALQWTGTAKLAGLRMMSANRNALFKHFTQTWKNDNIAIWG